MTRLRRIEDRDRIFFVTTNLARGTPALASGERELLLAQLARQRSSGEFLLFGYVVMPSHVHLLMAPAGVGLSALMREFKSRTAQQVSTLRSVRTPLWQPSYFDFILRRAGDFWEKLDYIHKNPVEGQLVCRAEDWRWSSAAHYGGGAAPVPVDSIDLSGDRGAWLYPAPWRRS